MPAEKRLPVVSGLDALTRDNPWPEFNYGDVPPFYLALDGGGRQLIVEAIARHGVTLMVEIGCFLCGSSRQWLDCADDLVVIGVDPWDGNWGPYLRDMAATPARRKSVETVEDIDRAIRDLESYGNFCCALNNIRAYKHRFIPVRRRSPEALEYLKKRMIEPQLIYIDAFKEIDDLYVADDLFPRALLCGDDWNWLDSEGKALMQENVKKFAAERGYTIRADRMTWILDRR